MEIEESKNKVPHKKEVFKNVFPFEVLEKGIFGVCMPDFFVDINIGLLGFIECLPLLRIEV